MSEFGSMAAIGDDPTAPEQPQDVTYTYWPVHYPSGDPEVIAPTPLPLSGVRWSVQGRGVGELRASLQLADPDVRAINPWGLVIPRRTGIVVVRTVRDPSGSEDHRAWHFVVWQAPVEPETGRMQIMAQTVESLWARRRISGPPPVGHRDPAGNLRPGLAWKDTDQATIARDLLNPNVFSQFGMLPFRGGLQSDEAASGAATTGIAYSGDLDVRAEMTPRTWRPQKEMIFARQYVTTGNQRSWQAWIYPSGRIAFRWSPDGTFTNAITVGSTVAIHSAARRATIRIFLDVNTGSGWSVTFYTSSDNSLGGSWTQLGSVVTGSPATAVFNGSTAPLEVAVGLEDDSFQPFKGTIHGVEVRDGAGAVTLRAAPDFAAQPVDEDQFTDSVGKVWTVIPTAHIVAGNPYLSWITVEAIEPDMGVVRTMSYRRGQNTNLLTAHQDRSKVINGYEWYTALRVLSGPNFRDATSWRLQMIWGHPRLGREYGTDDVPRFTYQTTGEGNVLRIVPVYDGSAVANVMWGSGSGYDDATVRAVAYNSVDWGHGFLMTEDEYANPDVSVAATLEEQTEGRMLQTYANERFLEGLTVRGDLRPHLTDYTLYDDCLVATDDATWPDNPDGSRGVTYLSRILGWSVTPPEGDQAEHVELRLLGEELQEDEVT